MKDFWQCSIYEDNLDNSGRTVYDSIGLFFVKPEVGADMSLYMMILRLLAEKMLQPRRLQCGYLALFWFQNKETRKYCASDSLDAFFLPKYDENHKNPESF
jgi:hypothetical protein